LPTYPHDHGIGGTDVSPSRDLLTRLMTYLHSTYPATPAGRITFVEH
jgi:hypothetical protein